MLSSERQGQSHSSSVLRSAVQALRQHDGKMVTKPVSMHLQDPPVLSWETFATSAGIGEDDPFLGH